MNVISASFRGISLRRISFRKEIFWAGFVLFPLCFLLICASDGTGNARAISTTAFHVPAQDSVVTVTLGFAGDLMCHVPQITNAKKPDGTYDFNPSFKEITPFLSKPDVTMANLECTFAGKGRPYGGYPAFNSPDEYLEAIKNSGIDFLVTSNNHSMDTGEEGLQRTLKKVRENNFGSTGTFDSQRDRDSIRILDVKGVKIAVLNYTYGTNGAYPSAAHKWMLNVADSALVRNDVLRARATVADIVLVFYHWGIENKQAPVAQQDTMFHWAADAGADLIIGAHPHVLEPVSYFKTAPNAKLDSGLVAWSLGNFISNQYWRYTDAGVILNLSITKNFTTGKMELKQSSYVPTWVYRSYDPSLVQHVVVPATWCNDSLPPWINTESKRKLCEAFSDTKLIMSKNSQKVILEPGLSPAEDLLKAFQKNKGQSFIKDSVYYGQAGVRGDGKPEKIFLVYPLSVFPCGHTLTNAGEGFYFAQADGTVTVDIVINKAGEVIRADVAESEAEPVNSVLGGTARQKAFQLKFTSVENCAETVGAKVVFRFRVR